ncbi:hypothetical protein EDC01DRAFT_667409 [Geopyxis carbonaria]|nr:hypothetical protein EDC01DRAFT_667409 [Geopyxis carbonaria]
MTTKQYIKPFLAASQRLLSNSVGSPSGKPLRVVTGNESADLDSITSSILYAYLSPLDPRPVPLLQIPREDIQLRPELLYVLKQLQLSGDDLLCIDDAATLRGAEVHLVDHNRLTWADLGAVHGIIDHHDDEGLYLDVSPRVIDKCGSCSSLVIETFFENVEREAGEKAELARLALAAVLIDTANMTQKVTAHDEKTLKILEKCVEAQEEWDRQKFYEDIRKAKQDVGDMKLRDLLRKDYKEWTEGKYGKLGIASVVKSLQWMKAREEGEAFYEGLKSWGEERGLDVLGVMTTDGEGDDFHRELLLWAIKDRGLDSLKWFEEKAEGAGMRLSPWNHGEINSQDGMRKAWKQKNIEMSRKQVAPLLRECVRAGKFGPSSKV